jgi:hypothetical protein
MYDWPERRGSRLFLVGSLVFVALCAGLCSSVASKQRVLAEMQEIFAGADWYIARPEAEQEWLGVLRERNVVLGPASRTAVNLELVVAERQWLPVYAANVGPQLAPYVRHRVTVRGKLVDLAQEGYGKELWIGWIRQGY